MTRQQSRPPGRLGPALVVALSLIAPLALAADGETVAFEGEGRTAHGGWRAEVVLSDGHWRAGVAVQLQIALHFDDSLLPGLAERKLKADKLCVLVTAERTFDSTGFLRLPSDERMSTLLTPGGLAIEGGIQGAVTNRYGYAFRTPLDVLESLPVAEVSPASSPGTRTARFTARATLPPDLPPGLYRLRLDFGVMVGARVYNLNGYTFATRPFTDQAGTSTYFYSPIVPASGPAASGLFVDALRLQPRIPWLLLSTYNSNGYRGVVADQDRDRFATSDRSLIPDDVILPMYDDGGKRLSYSLEPQFPADGIDPLQNIPWDWSRGELSAWITGPNGLAIQLGTARFVGKSGNGPTTGQATFKSWTPPAYGQYVAGVSGWIEDRWGRRYHGGGSYRFWIGRRMTLATATFQGMPYPVGARYGRDIQFNPAVPADVTVTAKLFPDSDRRAARVTSYAGKASPAGLYGAAQGMVPFALDAPGEYWAHVLATYVDAEGHLWVCSVRHAGIVYPPDSAVVARGKKVVVAGTALDRGETGFEGYVSADGESHLAHVGFPYRAGDVLLIAAEGQGANKIEPVLTYQMAGDAGAWDSRLNNVGTTNLAIKTSNGYSPHLFPEYITDMEYYYGAAPRPGFMGRFLVGESVVRAPYWPTSPNAFGGQIGASANGDAPGDIYRLLGGVVLRRAGQAPLYAGYLANAFILPKGSNNNRVVAAGAEDLVSPTGGRARFFLVGLRPGTAFEVGSAFRPALQIDPMVPASIHFELDYPDGRRQTADGVGDATGSFAGPAAWTLDVPGVYTYRVSGTWSGFEGRMPGLPESGGEFYVYSQVPAGAPRLKLDGAATRTFPAAGSLTLSGTTTAAVVHYALLMPGAVVEQGDLAVRGGRFQYVLDPAAIHAKVPLYDVVSVTTGKPQVGRVLHLTFFSEERGSAGGFFDLQRVIVRGTSALAPLAYVPATTATASSAAAAVPGSVQVHATDAGSLEAWERQLEGLMRAGELQLAAQVQDTLLPGRRHERLQQLHQGVPVFGGEVTRQSEDGVTVSAFGTLHAVGSLDPTPRVSAEEARADVERRTGLVVPAGARPRLVVLPLDGGGNALAWQVEARGATDVRVCFTDAHTGHALLEWSDLKAHAPASIITTFDLRGDRTRAGAAVARTLGLDLADVASSATPSWTDPAVVDAHANAGATDDYLRARFGRRGLDGRDQPILVLVHPARREDWRESGPALYHAGAFWDGRMVVLGEGLPDGATLGGRSYGIASAALDLVAHELAHGVIDASSRLVHRGESGALAEAFADIVATGVEFFAQPAGDGPGQADYRIGEDAVSGGGLRSLADPRAYGAPDHLSRRVAGSDDNGGVHANASIASHAFFLAVEGGTNRTSGRTVSGVGTARREQVEQVFYRAFVYLLPPTATLTTARAATLQSARDLHGPGSAVERALAEAWTAVGVQ